MVDSMSSIKTKINFRIQNGMQQRVNVDAHKVVRINVKTWYGRIFVEKNRSWLFNSSFWRERVVLNDDIWEKNQNTTSNISKSWRDSLFWFRIRILRQKLLRKRPIAFQQQIQTHYLQTCVIIRFQPNPTQTVSSNFTSPNNMHK